VEANPSADSPADLPPHQAQARGRQMNKALIIYLVNKKKKVTRQDVESKRALKELKKETTASF
jgi:hypothetical protein